MSKARETVQDPTPNIDADEVIRRFPEVRAIEDTELRALTVDALRYTPAYFWTVPASTSGKYHHPLAREEHGLWIHTKMAATVYEESVDSAVNQSDITDYEADCGRAAVLLHDQFKQGYPEDRPTDPDSQHTVGDHDVLAANWFRQHTTLPDPVIRAVEAHNGPWGEGDDPDDPLTKLVHQADLLASRPSITPAVLDPSAELIEAYPDIPSRTP